MSALKLVGQRLSMCGRDTGWRAFVLLLGYAVACGASDRAEAAITGLTRVASGLAGPIFMTHAPGDRDRLFIAERGTPQAGDNANATANIRILNLNTGALEATPFLSIPGINVNGEGGLLGLAFHPDYTGAEGDRLYVYVTANDSVAGTPFSSYIREYTLSANPNVANPTSRPILNWTQPQSNHNGGWIGFSPHDGFLYIMSGDGGNGDDTGTGHTSGTGNAQDITANLLGKAMRIDVDVDGFPGDNNRNYGIPNFQQENTNPFAPKPDPVNPGQFIDSPGDDEIWAYGLRNPYRASFDRATGDLWIGDVGQGAREEINFQAADFAGGANYGWRLREGLIQTPGSVGGAKPLDNVDPVYDYNRDNDAFGGTVVTGGYIYRGPDPTLQGKYFFLDSRNSASTSDDNYWTFDPANPFGTVANIDSLLTPNVGSRQFPVSFGEDAVGNLYIAYIVSGEVYRIATNALTPGDFDADADVDDDDLAIVLASFGMESGAGPEDGDADGDGDVDGDDFLAWQQNLGWSSLNVGSPGAAVPEPTGAALVAGAGTFLAAAARRTRRR